MQAYNNDIAVVQFNFGNILVVYLGNTVVRQVSKNPRFTLNSRIACSLETNTSEKRMSQSSFLPMVNGFPFSGVTMWNMA